MKYKEEIDVFVVEDQEDTLEDLGFVGFVLEI